MTKRILTAMLGLSVLAVPCAPAHAQTVEELQRQIDELKAMVLQLKAAQAAPAPAPAPAVAAPAPAPAPVIVASQAPRSKPWFERLSLRGYTQLRVNEILSGDRNAPAGVSRLRSVHDGGINASNNLAFRRVRLVFEGDLGDNVSFYLQPDFATSVSGQSAGERRENYGQLRDAYVDLHLGSQRQFKVRFGQSKVPFGWENLQSSSNRLALDRTDALNSAVPSERDLGIVAFYTPPHVQRIWKRLSDDKQKLFGNYGAFGVGVFNGQGVNRTESNNNLMTVAMVTWPFELDALGGALDGQVLELGGAAMRNKVQPEIRTGGVSAASYDDNRVGLHAILYPQPLGFQAEWNWGRGPEFDAATNSIATKSLNGGYIQTMLRIAKSPLGPMMPYARWQHYRGGWKAGLNAPRLETDEVEIGIEFQPIRPLEFTLAYAHMKRLEADERRSGRAEGDLLRAQLQWNY